MAPISMKNNPDFAISKWCRHYIKQPWMEASSTYSGCCTPREILKRDFLIIYFASSQSRRNSVLRYFSCSLITGTAQCSNVYQQLRILCTPWIVH